MPGINNRLIMTAALFIASTSCFIGSSQEADYKWSAGIRTGLAGYLGEYSGGNVFSTPGFNAAVSGSYIYDVRWSFSANAGFSYLQGSVSNVSGSYPETLHENFNASIGEISFRAEFNFLPYGIGETYKRLERWSPYVAAGVGIVLANPQGRSLNIAPEIPLAIGVRYKLNKRINLLAEFSFVKTFTDAIDGEKDIYGIKSEWFKNTDWTSSLTVGISYEFGERCLTCHYID